MCMYLLLAFLFVLVFLPSLMCAGSVNSLKINFQVMNMCNVLVFPTKVYDSIDDKDKIRNFLFSFFLFRNRLNLTEFMKYARFLLFFNCSSHVIPVFSSSLFIKQMNFIGNTRLSNDYIFFSRLNIETFWRILAVDCFHCFLILLNVQFSCSFTVFWE